MRNGLFAYYNFFCLVLVAYGHLLHEPSGFVMTRIGRLVIPLFSILAGFSWGGLLRRTRGEGLIYGLKLFLLPYLFWSIVYMLLNDVVLDCFIRHAEFAVSLPDVVYNLLTGHSALHLWFLITLVYVSIAITCLYRVSHGSKWFNFVVVGMLVLSIVLPEMNFMASSNRYVEYFHTWFFWLLPGFCIGTIASFLKAKAYEKWWIKGVLAPILGLLGVVMLFWGRGRGLELPLACALLVVALAFPRVQAPGWMLVAVPYSMGIYLVHALFTSSTNVALRLTPEQPMSECLAWPIAVAVFFVAWFAVWVMRKIPVIKNLV